MHNILENFSFNLLKQVANIVDDIEIRITVSKSTSFDITNDQILPKMLLNQPCIGIRVLKDGKISSVSSMTLDVKENVKAVKNALMFCTDSKLLNFTSNKTSKNTVKTFNKDLADFCKTERLFNFSKIIKDTCFKNSGSKIESLEGVLAYYEETKLIATKNSNNVFTSNALISHLDINALLVDQLYVTNNFEENIFEDFAKKTVSQLYKDAVTPNDVNQREQKPEVILYPHIFASIFKTLGLEKFKASNVISGLNDFKVGKQIFPNFVSISDDPTADYFLASSPFDDEGTTTEKKDIISKGIINNLLVSNLSSIKSKNKYKANGSAYRTSILAEMTHEAPIVEDFSNIIIEPGTTHLDEMIESISHGIMVTGLLGLHTANKATTEFSCGVMSGFYIKNGKIIANLVPGSWNISGCLFPYSNRDSFLKDAEFTSNRDFFGSGLAPYVRTRI